MHLKREFSPKLSLAGDLTCHVASHEVKISGGEQQLTIDVPRLRSLIPLRKHMANAEKIFSKVHQFFQQTVELRVAGVYAGQLFPKRSWFLKLFT